VIDGLKIFRKIIKLKIVLLALLLPLIFSGCSYFNVFNKHEIAKASSPKYFTHELPPEYKGRAL